MKKLMLLALLVSFFSITVHAEETITECPMIKASREANAKLMLEKSAKKDKVRKNKATAI